MANRWHHKPGSTADTERRRQYASRQHRELRKHWQKIVNAGQANCWRCGRWLPPSAEWHLGHDDNDRTIYRGAECPPCNLSAAARKGNQMQAAARTRRSLPKW